MVSNARRWSVQATTRVGRPVEEVFAFVADFENAPRWQSMVRASERLPGDPGEGGDRFREYASALGSRGWVTIDVTELEPPRRIGYRSSRFGALAPIARFSFTPDGDGTCVTFHGDPNPVAPLKPVAPVLALVAARMWRKNLEALRAVLER